LTDIPPPEPLWSAVYAGFGKAFRNEKGSWIEIPSYDYQFTVLQRRYQNRWVSVKEIHRLHPDYNGLAGPRDETLYFEVKVFDTENGEHDLAVQSTLGTGLGLADTGFENIAVSIKPEKVGLFTPFNSFRISQHYDFANGVLEETVELLDVKKGKEKPFMKMEEIAVIYLPASDGGPPH